MAWRGLDIYRLGAFNALLYLPPILMHKKRYTGTVADGRLLPNGKELSTMALTFFLFAVSFIFFRAESIGQAFDYIARMGHWETLKAGYHIFKQEGILFIFVLLCIEWFQRNADHGLQFLRTSKWPVRYGIYMIFIAILVFYWGENQQFIYFQF